MLQVKSIVVLALSSTLLWSWSGHPARADDLKVAELEQEVREIKREMQLQLRRIEALEREVGQSRNGLSAVPRATSPGPRTPYWDTSAAWLTIANWDRVRSGASELDVLSALGPPTAVRKSEDGARQTLLYSLEIAAGGFLSGQVVLSDHHVVQIQRPALK